MRDRSLQCGVINLYKPVNMTSFQAVSRVKRILGVKKAGHAGTLDPDAEGVLPVFLGTATGAFNYLSDELKEYTVEVILGIATDTCDLSGCVTGISDIEISFKRVKDVFEGIRGDIKQKPPIFSAVKVNGKRLYEYARNGNNNVDIPDRNVTIYSINVLSDELEHKNITIDQKAYKVSTFRAHVACSRGTYIRSLCRDSGIALGTYGCMGRLIRTRSGPYKLMDSVNFETLIESKEKNRVPLSAVGDLFEGYTGIYLDENQIKDYLNGKKVIINEKYYATDFRDGIVMVQTPENGFIGIGQLYEDECICYVKGKKMFCNPFI